MKLVDLEQLIHRAVKGQQPVAEVAEVLSVDTDRLAVYERMVKGHITGVLDGAFDLLKQIIEPARWAQIEAAYLAEEPPSHWSLSHAAEAFPGFLERCAQAERFGLTGVDVCLAQLEWEMQLTNFSTAAIPERGPVAVINPTLSILQQPYPLVPFAVALSRGEATRADAPEAGDCLVLLFQRPGPLHCAYYQADDDLLFALKAVDGGLTAEQAAEVAGQPLEVVQAVYRQAAEIGLIIPAA